MATTPPLHGIRIIECSALGPAQITTPLVDLGAEVIKVEPPAGDYIREMTWPIVEGTSLMHLHLNRGKRSLVLDLRRRRRRHFEGARRHRRCGRRGDVPRITGATWRRVRRPEGDQPQDRLLHHLGHGMTGPYRDYPSHGVAYDTWAGIVNVATDEEGFTYIPEHASIGIHAGPLFGALGILAAVIRARATGEGSYIDIAQSDAAAAMDWLRSETWRAYERPESEVTGNKATATSAVLRAPQAWWRASATRSTRRPTSAMCCSWRRNRPSGGASARAWSEWTSSSVGPAPSTPTTRRQPRAPARAAGHLPHEDGGGMARVRRSHQHTDRAGQHPQDAARGPPIRRSVPPPPRSGHGSRPALHPAALRRRGAAAPVQGANRRTAHRGRLALRARL